MSQVRELDKDSLNDDEDWNGNNAAFTCPHCSNVFVVSGYKNPHGRRCTSCKKSKGVVAKDGTSARLEW